MRILRTLVLAAALSVPVLTAAPAQAGPCPQEGTCPPCPIVITFNGYKPQIESAQC